MTSTAGFQRGWAIAPHRETVAHVWRRAAGGFARLCLSRDVVRFLPDVRRPPLIEAGSAHRCCRCRKSDQAWQQRQARR
jgi:hypothetical protein